MEYTKLGLHENLFLLIYHSNYIYLLFHYDEIYHITIFIIKGLNPTYLARYFVSRSYKEQVLFVCFLFQHG